MPKKITGLTNHRNIRVKHITSLTGDRDNKVKMEKEGHE